MYVGKPCIHLILFEIYNTIILTYAIVIRETNNKYITLKFYFDEHFSKMYVFLIKSKLRTI